jgi:hypothetical protein
VWEDMPELPFEVSSATPPPERASSDPGGAPADILLTFEDVSECIYLPADAPHRRVSWPPAIVDALVSAGRLDIGMIAALREWEAELDARERRIADEVARRRDSEARLEREMERCEALLALGFSRGRVNAEMRLAERDAAWFDEDEDEGEGMGLM